RPPPAGPRGLASPRREDRLAAEKEAAFARGQAGPAGFVFADGRGTPLEHRRLGRVLTRALAGAGLPRLCWHDLRHVAASALIAGGVSVTFLSRLLGHASPAITLAVYAHEFAKAEQGDRMREQMEAVYGGLLV